MNPPTQNKPYFQYVWHRVYGGIEQVFFHYASLRRNEPALSLIATFASAAQVRAFAVRAMLGNEQPELTIPLDDGRIVASSTRTTFTVRAETGGRGLSQTFETAEHSAMLWALFLTLHNALQPADDGEIELLQDFAAQQGGGIIVPSTMPDMRRFVPSNLRAGMKGGLFGGVIAGIHVAVGQQACTHVDSKSLHLDGRYKVEIPGIVRREGTAKAHIEFTGPRSANLTLFDLDKDPMDATVEFRAREILYRVRSGPLAGAEIVQHFGEQGWFSGAYVQFNVRSDKIPVTGYAEAKYWFDRV